MFTRALVLLFVLFLAGTTVNGEPDGGKGNPPVSMALDVDNGSYINANRILMFVDNTGSFGADHDNILGFYDGTYCPYVSNTMITNGILADHTPLGLAGIWLGGVVGADIRVALSGWDNEYVPGPMEGGTYLPDDPTYKVYKLYSDSLEGNPNDDYTNWPVDQGAPVDERGWPLMIGDQMLWTVFNDSDPAAHVNSGGGSAPLGVEVQLTAWAVMEDGTDTLPTPAKIVVGHTGSSDLHVVVDIIDEAALTGDTYGVVTHNDVVLGRVWSIVNVSTGTTVLADQTDLTGVGATDTIDGFHVKVTDTTASFTSFEVVANGSGVLDPPLPGALSSVGFPTPGDADPGTGQQVGSGRWAIHTADNGGTSGGGTRDSISDFLVRVFRGDKARIAQLGEFDFELRFTGSYDNPGVNGSYCWEWSGDLSTYWVPFELWRTGVGTPDDPSDDVRMLPYVFGDGGTVFDMSSYGSDALGNCGPGGCEHSASDGDDDPYTGDWFYWRLPADDSPGESGYSAFEAEMLADPTSRVDDAVPVMDRMVLINVDGGVQPPFTQDLPEQGTIFRITTQKGLEPDTFTFVANPPMTITSGPDGVSVYLKYKLYNRGSNTIDSCFAGLRTESMTYTNLACDTLDDLFYWYSPLTELGAYGSRPPAIGFKLIRGPVVPSTGDTADFEGHQMLDYRNLGMTSLMHCGHAAYPSSPSDAYNYLRGILRFDPYVYEGDTLKFMRSGDPIAGTGDIQTSYDTPRAISSSGPFTFNPGDSQFVMIKMAVGFGEDNLSAITRMREILNMPFSVPTGADDAEPDNLPRDFSLGQNYPNPFNPSTTIEYSLAKRSDVSISIYNVLGQKVVTLVDGIRAAGEYEVVWDGTDDSGEAVSTGVYFYRITTDDFVGSKKMLLLK